MVCLWPTGFRGGVGFRGSPPEGAGVAAADGRAALCGVTSASLARACRRGRYPARKATMIAPTASAAAIIHRRRPLPGGSGVVALVTTGLQCRAPDREGEAVGGAAGCT